MPPTARIPDGRTTHAAGAQPAALSWRRDGDGRSGGDRRAGTVGAWQRAQGARGRRSGKVPKNRRGIQLYTMRRIMDKSQADASSVLRWLGRKGYTEVETAGHYGWTAGAVPPRARPGRPEGHLGPRRPGLPLPGRLAGQLRGDAGSTRRRSARSSPASPGTTCRRPRRSYRNLAEGPRRGRQAMRASTACSSSTTTTTSSS